MQKFVESVMANTLLDRQNEKLTIEALEALIDSIEKFNIPITIEHDPRKPPIGRINDAYIRKRTDGEYEAVSILEFFDNDLSVIQANNKEFPVRSVSENLEISFSFSHKNTIDQNDILFISELLKSKPNYEAKKSADPISILSLTGAFVLGGIAAGFLNKIGADIWDLIKPKIIKLLSKNKSKKADDLLIFKVIVENFGKSVEIDIILTNPDIDDIDLFLTKTTFELDKVISVYLEFDNDIRKLVFELKGNHLTLNYALRKDCIPVFFNRSVKEILDNIK